MPSLRPERFIGLPHLSRTSIFWKFRRRKSKTSSGSKMTTDGADATAGTAGPVGEPIKFGTDGWRGVIADEFTFPNVRRVAAGTVAFLKQNPPAHPGPLLVGYDRR